MSGSTPSQRAAVEVLTDACLDRDALMHPAASLEVAARAELWRMLLRRPKVAVQA